MITREILVNKLKDYLYHNITRDELVDWAEKVMMEEELEAENFNVLRDIIARLGVADVREFGLTWEDFEEIFRKLGYRISIHLSEVE